MVRRDMLIVVGCWCLRRFGVRTLDDKFRLDRVNYNLGIALITAVGMNILTSQARGSGVAWSSRCGR